MIINKLNAMLVNENNYIFYSYKLTILVFAQVIIDCKRILKTNLNYLNIVLNSILQKLKIKTCLCMNSIYFILNVVCNLHFFILGEIILCYKMT